MRHDETKDQPARPGFPTAARCTECREVVRVRGTGENTRHSCGCTDHAEVWARAAMGLGPSEPFPLRDDPRWGNVLREAAPAVRADGPVPVAEIA